MWKEFKMSKCIQKDRVSLLPNNVETLLFRKHNFRAVSYSTLMPQVSWWFYSTNDRIYDNLDSDNVRINVRIKKSLNFLYMIYVILRQNPANFSRGPGRLLIMRYLNAYWVVNKIICNECVLIKIN